MLRLIPRHLSSFGQFIRLQKHSRAVEIKLKRKIPTSLIKRNTKVLHRFDFLWLSEQCRLRSLTDAAAFLHLERLTPRPVERHVIKRKKERTFSVQLRAMTIISIVWRSKLGQREVMSSVSEMKCVVPDKDCRQRRCRYELAREASANKVKDVRRSSKCCVAAHPLDMPFVFKMKLRKKKTIWDPHLMTSS